MNSRITVLAGMVATCLISALAASDLIPGLFMSFIVLAGGVVATFYIALSQKRSDRLADLNLMLKASQEINAESFQAAIFERLEYWARRLMKCETVLLYFDNRLIPEQDLVSQPEWDELVRLLKEKKESVLFNRSDPASPAFAMPERIQSLLAVPLRIGDSSPALVLLVNEQEKGFFNEQDREFIQYLTRQAATAWGKDLNYRDMDGFHQQLLESLLAFFESQRPMFLGHARRVAAVSEILGQKMGLDGSEMKALKYAALLHDIGRYVNIPGELAKADGESDSESRDNIDCHSSLGAEAFTTEGIFKEIREGILYHHERYDGSGFPEGLDHTDIPLNARIIAVADLYDAMTRLCPEEERLDHAIAVRAIKKAMGSLLDPLVVVVLEEIEAELEEILK